MLSKKCFFTSTFKKEWTADIYNNMDDLKSIIVSEKKQDTKEYGLYDFICVKF